jgi:hypothetical protein
LTQVAEQRGVKSLETETADEIPMPGLSELTTPDIFYGKWTVQHPAWGRRFFLCPELVDDASRVCESGATRHNHHRDKEAKQTFGGAHLDVSSCLASWTTVWYPFRMSFSIIQIHALYGVQLADQENRSLLERTRVARVYKKHGRKHGSQHGRLAQGGD